MCVFLAWLLAVFGPCLGLPPPVFQLRKIDALRSITRLTSLAYIYIYIYIYNPSEIYIYIYILKKIIRAPPYEIISGKNRGGSIFLFWD